MGQLEAGYRLAADLVLLAHLGFAVFALFGGLLVLRRPRLVWLHLPALLWAVVVQWGNLFCPLTPLENFLRERGGQAGYDTGFIEHYVSMLIYPDGLTVELRYLIGLIVVAVNTVVYGVIFLRRKKE
jgi:hypothetical protein